MPRSVRRCVFFAEAATVPCERSNCFPNRIFMYGSASGYLGDHPSNNSLGQYGQDQHAVSYGHSAPGTALGFLPIQVGTPTAFARRHRNTFLYLLIFQLVILVMRIVYDFNVIGCILQVLFVLAGFYAWRLDLNITWMIMYGLLVTGAFVYDIFFCFLAEILSLTTSATIDFLTGMLTSLSEGLGVFFAWCIWMNWRGKRLPFGLGADDKDVEDDNPYVSDVPSFKGNQQNWTGAYGHVTGSAATNVAPVNVDRNPFMTHTV